MIQSRADQISEPAHEWRSHAGSNHNDTGVIVMANSFEHISISAVKVLARLAAKKAVQAKLKDQGVRVTLVRPWKSTHSLRNI